MTQDLESVMLDSLEGTFTTYAGNESIYSYNQRDPLQRHYGGLRSKMRRAAVKASLRAVAAHTAQLPKTDTRDAILSLRPLAGPMNDVQFKAGLFRMSVLLRATAAGTGVPVDDIKSTSRMEHACRARQIFFWLARHYSPCSFPQIGNYLGKDHSTVVHGVKKVSARIADYPELEKIKTLLEVDGNLMVRE